MMKTLYSLEIWEIEYGRYTKALLYLGLFTVAFNISTFVFSVREY